MKHARARKSVFNYYFKECNFSLSTGIAVYELSHDVPSAFFLLSFLEDMELEKMELDFDSFISFLSYIPPLISEQERLITLTPFPSELENKNEEQGGEEEFSGKLVIASKEGGKLSFSNERYECFTSFRKGDKIAIRVKH